VSYEDIAPGQISSLVDAVCAAAGENRDDVFPPAYQSTHLALIREIEDRVQSLNDQVHIGNLSRAKQVIRDNWTEIPPDVQLILVAIRDNIIALRGDEP